MSVRDLALPELAERCRIRYLGDEAAERVNY